MRFAFLVLSIFCVLPESAGENGSIREGVSVIIQSVDGELVRVDELPISFDSGRVSSTLETAINDPRGSRTSSTERLDKLVGQLPVGTVYLRVRNADGTTRAVVPLSRVDAYASHDPIVGDSRIRLDDGYVEFRARPRINFQGATISVVQKGESGLRDLGNLRIIER